MSKGLKGFFCYLKCFAIEESVSYEIHLSSFPKRFSISSSLRYKNELMKIHFFLNFSNIFVEFPIVSSKNFIGIKTKIVIKTSMDFSMTFHLLNEFAIYVFLYSITFKLMLCIQINKQKNSLK